MNGKIISVSSVKGGVGASNLDGSLKVGGGAEAKYATDAFSATVAADMVYGKKNNTFDAAVSAKVVTVPVTVDSKWRTWEETVTITVSETTTTAKRR